MTDNKPVTYEYDRIADRKRLDFISAAVAERKGNQVTVLDVGCGNGVISRHLGMLGFNVLGIDVSEPAIARARELNTSPRVNFKVLSAEQLVAAGDTFDVIVCSEVLEHLQQPGALLATLYQSLRKDGILIVTVPNGTGPRELLVTRPVLKMREQNNWLWKLVLKTKKAMGYSGTTVQSAADNLDHIQFFKKSDLETLSTENNFRIVRFGKANFIEDVFPFSFFAKRIKALQWLDCKVADMLPYRFTGGFFSVWEKAS
ncbi:class I SAM-dependent methyltransferase [Chitinophaga varians]|uniref:class I SAM-dependent methyltransferase n=1 Tax=Chitinophaga varians TaxID=2202339 RepID=UPI00165F2F31|nr:methyltransferase domain-containing protein [Chitinophaga varians]MBC9915458.1 methyltransferase domain-containing protein [Chitinophaga varians]